MFRVALIAVVASALLESSSARSGEPTDKLDGAAKAAAEKALPLLKKGAEGHIAKKKCFACHSQAMPMLAITTAQDRGFTVKGVDLKKQAQFIADFLDGNQANYKEGRGQGGQVDTAGYALFALELGGWTPDETTNAVVEYLLQRDQNADHWRPVSNRPPTEASHFTTNYLAIRALKKWGADSQKERIARRIDVVRNWILKTPANDTEDRVFRLYALQIVGEPELKRQPAVEELLQSQRKDGGWGQLDALDSDAYATGSALVALHQAGGLATSDPAYQRGIAFLLKSQQADGSWHVRSRSKPFQPYYETGFPHGKDQFISSTASSWATTALVLSAQQSPYDVFPPADPPYYRVRYGASTDKGELVYPVNYTIWIPKEVKLLRGVIVHQHGCGEGSCKSGLTGAYDLHWQALAKKHDCALLSPSYEQPDKADCQLWCDPRNGSDAAFQKCLVDLGAKSGHPELSNVPWALWGHSGGGHWAGGMVLVHPNRVAAAWLRSGVPMLKANPKNATIKAHTLPDAALKVPVMCNLGTKEGVTEKGKQFAGVWPANETFFNEVRGKGGLISVAIDPLSSHECGNQRYFAIPWLDACLSARLPKVSGDSLRAMPTDQAWLAPITGAEAVPAAKFAGDPLKAAWLPNEAIAKAWMQYVKDTAVSDVTPPPAPTNLRLKGNELTWEAEADLESGLASFIIERDGKFLAKVPEQGKNPFGRPVFQNLQYSDTPPQPLVPMRYTDTRAEPGKKYTYRVIAVNTVGLKSMPSAERAGPEKGVELYADDWQPDPQFRSLFNGKDLTGWCFRAKPDKKSPNIRAIVEKFDGKTESSDNGRYSAKDGILTVNFPKGKDRLIAQLDTVEEFPKDFILKLEFRASVNADSGIFIRRPQLQCRDYLVAGPYKDLKKYKAQDWNQIEIVVKGKTARCTCNGELLEAAFAVPETGPIGLEGDRGQMEYRRIQITMP